MVVRELTVNLPGGIYLKEAAALAKCANGFASLITCTVRDYTANAKSILSLLAACANQGDDLELVCAGADEEEAADAVEKLITGGKGEHSCEAGDDSDSSSHSY